MQDNMSCHERPTSTFQNNIDNRNRTLRFSSPHGKETNQLLDQSTSSDLNMLH